MTKVIAFFGTWPEAIALAPEMQALRASPTHFHTLICATSQHREMVNQVLPVFDLRPDYDVDVMAPGQTPFGSASPQQSG